MRYLGGQAGEGWKTAAFITYTNTSTVKEVVKSITVRLGTGYGTFTAGDVVTGSGETLSFFLYAKGNSAYSSSDVDVTSKCYETAEGYPYYDDMSPYTVKFDKDVIVNSGETISFTIGSYSSYESTDVLCFDRRQGYISGVTSEYVNSYTVSYDANGGSGAPSSQTKIHGQTLTLSSTKPTKSTVTNSKYTVEFDSNSSDSSVTDPSSKTATKTTSYTFSSWNTAKDGSGTSYASGGSYTANAAATLYAQYTSKTNGGSITLPSLSRTGYKFLGWYTAAAGGTNVGSANASYTPSKNITLYAHWEANQYTVTFVTTGGTVSPKSKDVTFGSTYGTLPTPEYTGHKFLGWYTAASGGSKITSNTVVSTASNHGIFAHWELATYTITYNANGGSGAPDSQTKTHGENLTISSTRPTKSVSVKSKYTVSFDANGSTTTLSDIVAKTVEVYTFSNWNTSANGSGTSYSAGGTYSANASATLYAQYTSTTSGGSITLPTVSRIGYSLYGWYTASSGGTRVGAAGDTYIPTQNITIYAHWQANTYTVSYDANGGSVSSESKSVTYDSDYGTLPTPNYTGHDFTGWYTSKSGGTKVTSTTKVSTASDHTLYARWGTQQYTVTFNPYGGTVSPTSKSVTYGQPYGDLPSPDRPGYTFLGWSMQTSGTDRISESTIVTETQDHTLYAHWAANSYQVTFNPNGGSVSPTSKSVTFDSTYGDLPTPSKAGHTFAGWYTSKSGGTKISSSTVFKSTSNVTLYAHWTINKYTLTLEDNGGSVSPSSYTEDYNTEITLPTPTKSYKVTFNGNAGTPSEASRTLKCSFDGWYTSSDLSGTKYAAGSKYKISNNATLYAKWVNPKIGTLPTSTSSSYYTITYDSQRGSAVPSQKVYKVFSSWNTAQAGTGTKISSTYTISGNITLYAQYNNPKFVVPSNPTKVAVLQLDPNGGKVSPTYKSYICEFKGWYSAKSNGTRYTSDSDIVSNIVVYAQWLGMKVGTLPTPEYANHTFAGWYYQGKKLTEDYIISDNTIAVAMYGQSPIWIRIDGQWIPYI